MPLEGSCGNNVVVTSTSNTVAGGGSAAVTVGGAAKTSVASASIVPTGKINKRTSRLSSLAEDVCFTPDGDAPPYRARLHLLFAQIEKEFEALYLDNLNRKHKIKIKIGYLK